MTARDLRPDGPAAGQCRSCGAAVLWVLHERRRANQTPSPLDAAPVADGNLRIVDGRYQVVSNPTVRDLLRAQGEPLYVSHFATCPQANRWHVPRRPIAGAT